MVRSERAALASRTILMNSSSGWFETAASRPPHHEGSVVVLGRIIHTNVRVLHSPIFEEFTLRRIVGAPNRCAVRAHALSRGPARPLEVFARHQPGPRSRTPC